MEGDEEIEGELRDEGEQQDSPDDSQVSYQRSSFGDDKKNSASVIW